MRQGIDPAMRLDIVWHEPLNLAVLDLTTMRLLRVALRSAPSQTTMPKTLRLASKAMHGVLSGLLLALPITAPLALATERHPLTLLMGVRVNEIPMIAHSALAHLVDWGDVHPFLNDAIMWLAGRHAAAALYHHFVRKDSVLKSMLPSRSHPKRPLYTKRSHVNWQVCS